MILNIGAKNKIYDLIIVKIAQKIVGVKLGTLKHHF
jgi:hypothetical protein